MMDLFCPNIRLKVRMRDLDRSLRSVNRTLWEDLCNSSEEEVLKDKYSYKLQFMFSVLLKSNVSRKQ